MSIQKQKNLNEKKVLIHNDKEEKIRIYLTIFLIVFASIFAFITAYQSTKIVMTTVELTTLYAEEQKNEISFENTNNYLIEGQEYTVKINLNETNITSTYIIQVVLNNNKIEELTYNDVSHINTSIKLSQYFVKEGANNIDVAIFENNSKLYNCSKIIYYIKPYKKQFLDELTYQSVCIKPKYMSDLTPEILLLKSLGVNQVRTDILLTSVYKDGQKNFKNVDNWVSKFLQNDIDIELVVNTDKNSTLFGNDGKISSEEELNNFLSMINEISNKYSSINKFEILNEPNFYYTSQDDLYWYSRMVKNAYEILKSRDENNKIIAGATAIINNGNINSIPFIQQISQMGVYNESDSFSTHFYDFNVSGNNNTFETLVKNHLNEINELGGFQDINISEYGISTGDTNLNDEQKAEKLIQQSNILKQGKIKTSSIYSFIDNQENSQNSEDNFGLLHYDYTPKPAYYAMKNYYQNTNGSEYIGTINLAEGLETHVYNKDGKPKIITWATDNTKNVTIPYENFTVTDLYGDAIQSVDGKLTITSSPVYIDNISTSYYYKAISNTALEKYNEFEEKFKDELAKVPTIQTNIMVQKTYMQNLANQTGITQDIAIQEMKKHYDIGTQLIKAYNQKQLNIEYVKLSSMLDMLDEIGNSYEDLVTISATTRNADLQTTNNNIQETEKLIENNQNLEIIYPEKILMFSKDYYDKAEYINSLEKENPIKTGLIVSKNLHSELLASWAKDFVNIYIQKYMEEHKPTITYSITNMTNKDVIATLNSDIDIKVTNNDGNKTYTFTQNGTFTFKYMVNDIEYEITATVNNIDKTLPVISGVQNGQTYYTEQKIAPKATDQNLQNVDLYLNNVKVDYQNGQVIQVEGIYRLVATDKAGNSVTVQFQVMKKPESKYNIENNSIKGIQYNTTKDQFDKNVGLTESYTITRNSSSLKQTDIIASGDILTTKSGKKYTLIVAGDLTKDGKVTVDDFTRMRLYLLGLRKLDDVEKMSADANCDGEKISIDDYIRIRILILQQLSWK